MRAQHLSFLFILSGMLHPASSMPVLSRDAEMTKSHTGLQLIPTEVSGTADVQVDPHITTADLGTTSEVRGAMHGSVACPALPTVTKVTSKDFDLSTTCSATAPMCYLVSHTFATPQCAAGCGMSYDNGKTSPFYTGGPDCNGGQDICTCSMSAPINTLDVPKKADAVPMDCASACMDQETCKYAVYKRAAGKCYLLSKCDVAIKTWVGKGSTQGLLTFAKYVPPARALKVNPGENIWPEEWFGSYKWGTPYGESRRQEWDGKEGTKAGFDWSLPSTVKPSSRAHCTLVRQLNELDKALADASELPDPSESLSTFTQPAMSVWVQWKEVEPTEGTYDFSKVLEVVDAVESKGWKVAIRLMTSSEKRSTPEWLAHKGIPMENLMNHKASNDLNNYDVNNTVFNEYYVNLVHALGETGICARSSVFMMYVGYASPSWGDEGIGPHGKDYHGPTDTPIVKSRLDAWAKACAGNERKMLMGGFSEYGASKGFGMRGGFIEHYWYQIPSNYIGQVWSSDQPYLTVNESAPIISNALTYGSLMGDVNEEGEPNWSSDYRTNKHIAGRGGKEDLSAPELGANARYGPLASFTYRYFMSQMRVVQQQLNWDVLPRFELNAAVTSWSLLEMGREASTGPDAWAFLVETSLTKKQDPLGVGGPVKNWEKWLHQRDNETLGVKTVREAKITQTPAAPSPRCWLTSENYDYIAKAAPGGVIGFKLDTRFTATAPKLSWVIKVSFFDVVAAGTLSITVGADCWTKPQILATQATTGDGTLKTATFNIAKVGEITSRTAATYDFELRGYDAQGTSQEIVVSMLRVIKVDSA